MVNFTRLGFKEIIQHGFERKQLALLVTLDFYYRKNKKVLKKQICKESSILPESFSRSLKRLNDCGLFGYFIYDEQTKSVNSSFKLNQTKTLHIQAPTYLLKVGALTNNALAVIGYLKAMPKGEWNGSCYKLHQKINVWFKKHKINFSLSLTSIYKAIKILKHLNLIEKVEFKAHYENRWIWNIKIKINQKIINEKLKIKVIIELLKQLTIKPLSVDINKLEQEEIWDIFD